MNNSDLAAALASALPREIQWQADKIAAHQAARLAEQGWVLVRPDDEATVDRLSLALMRWNNPPDPYFVIRGRTLEQTYDGDPYVLIVEAVLAALRDAD